MGIESVLFVRVTFPNPATHGQKKKRSLEYASRSWTGQGSPLPLWSRGCSPLIRLKVNEVTSQDKL